MLKFYLTVSAIVLRSREFLWQEGHTVFASKEEADEEVLLPKKTALPYMY
jgi:prolyl-tRNA synthetase